MSKQSNDLPQHSWAEARAIIKAEMESNESEHEYGYCCSDCEGDHHEEPAYDCMWCKDGEDTTAPCIHNAERREQQEQDAAAYAAACTAQEEKDDQEEYAAALMKVRAEIESLPAKTYGPFKEGIIIAETECNLIYGTKRTKEWYAAYDTYEAVNQWRGWCFNKMPSSISSGW